MSKNPGIYARRDYVGNDDNGGLQFNIEYWNLGIGGYEFPKAAVEMLFRDDTPGNIIRPNALFPRDYVFKQFSTTKPNLYQGPDSNWQEIPYGSGDWDFTAGYFPELKK